MKLLNGNIIGSFADEKETTVKIGSLFITRDSDLVRYDRVEIKDVHESLSPKVGDMVLIHKGAYQQWDEGTILFNKRDIILIE